MDTIRWKKNDATVEVWGIYIHIYTYTYIYIYVIPVWSCSKHWTRASAWNSDALGPKFGHHNLPKGVLDFHGAQPGGFQQTKRKTHGGRWTAPKKSSKKPKFHPSIQGACEGITQTVCDGNLWVSSVRYRVAGFSKKNPWRQPSPQIILKARNPVWSGGRVEKNTGHLCKRARAHAPIHAWMCMHAWYVRTGGRTYLVTYKGIASHITHRYVHAVHTYVNVFQ